MRRGSWIMVLSASMACGEPGPEPIDPSTSSETAPDSTSPSSPSDTSADGSSGPTPGERRSLVEPDAWVAAEAAEDPFAAERPARVDCALGWGEETGAFEVSTDLCNYGAFVQPALAPIYAGDTLELVMLHDALYFPEPAVAHVGIALGDQIAWETELTIPAEAALLRPSWTAPADLPAGTPVHFHVHNHGVNNYRLVDLIAEPP